MATTENTFINVPGGIVKTPPHPLLVKLEGMRGTSQYYNHPQYKKLLYTDGVRLLAREGECYWLLDLVASVMMTKLARNDYMMLRITTKDNRGVVRIVDSENPEAGDVYMQKIPFTDFPFESFQIQMSWIPFGPDDSRHLLLYLISED